MQKQQCWAVQERVKQTAVKIALYKEIIKLVLDANTELIIHIFLKRFSIYLHAHLVSLYYPSNVVYMLPLFDLV